MSCFDECACAAVCFSGALTPIRILDSSCGVPTLGGQALSGKLVSLIEFITILCSKKCVKVPTYTQS